MTLSAALQAGGIRLELLTGPLTGIYDPNGMGAMFLTGDGPPARSRAAACLMLLYAQPASRIVRLTVDDVLRDGDQVLIRLGEPPSPVPQALARILLELVDNRQNLNSATNSGSHWLFPGQRAGQPLHSRTLLTLIHQLGIPAQATRVAALRQLVLQAPAPVIADALGAVAQDLGSCQSRR